MNKRIGHLTPDTLSEVFKDLSKVSTTPFKNSGRQVAQIGSDYTYSGVTHTGLSWDSFPSIKSLMDKVSKATDSNFNSCLINVYPAGKTVGIGKHTDAEPELEHSSAVVSVSLGESCEFVLENIKSKEKKVYLLNHGDVFLMDKGCQQEYLHSIPRKKYTLGRISLTFREMNHV